MKADAGLVVQLAIWAGQHALPLFFLLLTLLLAATAAGWPFLLRVCARRTLRAGSPRPAIGRRLAAGISIILAGAAVFAGLATQLGAAQALVRADQALTDALDTSVEPLTQQVFAALTHLADTATLTVLCIGMAIALIALRRRGLALGWVVALAGNGLLNQTLKQMVGRARPLEQHNMVQATGLSFPSGHSSGAVVAYGMLGYLALRLLPRRWQLPTLLVAVTLAFTVGASRLLLRVHFASDVLAGIASGTAWLALCITGIELLRWWRSGRA